jgi:hypothetical protein
MGGEARGGDGEAWCGGFWGNGAAMSAHDGGGARGNGSGFLFPPRRAQREGEEGRNGGMASGGRRGGL